MLSCGQISGANALAHPEAKQDIDCFMNTLLSDVVAEHPTLGPFHLALGVMHCAGSVVAAAAGYASYRIYKWVLPSGSIEASRHGT